MGRDMERRREQGRRAQRKHYQKKKQYYRQKAREQKQKIRAWLRALKATLSCTRCGEDHQACISFHHRDRKTKFKEVSQMATDGYSTARIMKEIDKCDVLCENCHRKLEWKIQHDAG